MSSAPRMGGAARARASRASGSGVGRAALRVSSAVSAPHTLATKLCPTSRQKPSVGSRCVDRWAAPRWSAPWPRPLEKARVMRRATASAIGGPSPGSPGSTSMPPLGKSAQTRMVSRVSWVEALTRPWEEGTRRPIDRRDHRSPARSSVSAKPVLREADLGHGRTIRYLVDMHEHLCMKICRPQP